MNTWCFEENVKECHVTFLHETDLSAFRKRDLWYSVHSCCASVCECMHMCICTCICHSYFVAVLKHMNQFVITFVTYNVLLRHLFTSETEYNKEKTLSLLHI